MQALNIEVTNPVTCSSHVQLMHSSKGRRVLSCLFPPCSGTLCLHPHTHFSHMSHTPFPHISEFNSCFLLTSFALALPTLAEVESTATGAALSSPRFSLEVGGGYANAEGGAAHLYRQSGIWSCALRPIAAVGVKASDAKSERGCQNQKCEKTPMPTMDVISLWPDLERREMVT